ncbi:MAG: sensor domain-containing diguanylate cyclase [Candidatus Omnitrophica bacterium]|nr:sensor domain-containing diguanylate cyclase [Candidatus Omnitrophota bacterium]
MAPSAKRAVLGIFSLALFILSTFLLYRIPPGQVLPAPSCLKLADTLIVSYNIAIILAYLAFGTMFGLGITIFSSFLVLLFCLRISIIDHSILAVSFLLSAIFGHIFWRHRNKLVSLYQLKLERLGEDINILTNEIEEKRRGIFSVEEKLRRYAALKEVIDSFSTQLVLDDITKLIMEKTSKTISKQGRTLLFLVDTEKQELMLSASRGAARIAAKKGDLFDRWVLKNRKSLISEDIVTDFRFSLDNEEGLKKIFRSVIATPLVSGDKIIGILRMDNVREFAYTQDDLRLLGIIADLGAVAIENAFLYAKTQELAIKDSLTGLSVRRYFLERLHKEIKRTAMKKGQLSLLMLDIDHFKSYNDQFGHAAGDIILRHISQILSSMIRSGDITARYGGEEIVIMLCGRSKKEAFSEAEEIRQAVKNRPVTFRRHVANVTVSIGIASYPEDASASEGLIRIADERLYKAKDQGRDRVCQG